MPQTTPNYGLTTFDPVTDKTESFLAFRSAIAGTGVSTNFMMIDELIKDRADETTALKGVGYVAETVKGNADNIASLKQKGIYTAIMTGTNTLTSTVADLTTVPANTTLRIVPSAKNTTNVTVSINSETALPLVKVRNTSGSTVYTSLESGDLQPNMPVFISKTPDSVRYVIVGFGETYARNVFYDNGDNTFTNLQTKIDLKANKLQESWSTPSLLNSWVNYGAPFSDAKYFKDDFGIVHLKGMVKNGSSGGFAIFILPSGYRPVESEVFAIHTDTGHGVVTIDSSGNVLHVSGGTGLSSLSGITFKTT